MVGKGSLFGGSGDESRWKEGSFLFGGGSRCWLSMAMVFMVVEEGGSFKWGWEVVG